MEDFYKEIALLRYDFIFFKIFEIYNIKELVNTLKS